MTDDSSNNLDGVSDRADLPVEKIIRMWGEDCSSGLWNVEGMPIYPEDLPIPEDLKIRLDKWAKWYDDVEWVEAGTPWEASPGTPVDEFNAEGRALAYALKSALGPGWRIIAFDVDAWRYPAEDQQHRRLELPLLQSSETVTAEAAP